MLNDQKMQMLEAEADTRASEALYRQASTRSGAHLTEAILVGWDEPTQAMFATILSFWFGGRQYRKIMGAHAQAA